MLLLHFVFVSFLIFIIFTFSTFYFSYFLLLYYFIALLFTFACLFYLFTYLRAVKISLRTVILQPPCRSCWRRTWRINAVGRWSRQRSVPFTLSMCCRWVRVFYNCSFFILFYLFIISQFFPSVFRSTAERLLCCFLFLNFFIFVLLLM